MTHFFKSGVQQDLNVVKVGAIFKIPHLRRPGVLSNLVKAIEFRRISPNGLIRVMSFQELTLSPEGYHLIKILFQEKHGTPFKVVKDLSMLPKFSFFWIFETSFIKGLP